MEEEKLLRALIVSLLITTSLAQAKDNFCPLAEMQRQAGESSLLVFVSFSMPEQSLKQLAKQVKEKKGVLVLRGLHNNSYKQTLKKIYSITKDAQSGFVVDPRLFEEFQVETVPTFIKKQSDSLYQKVSGDVSLIYALNFLQESGEQP